MAKQSALGGGAAAGGPESRASRLGLAGALALYRDYRLLWVSTVLTQIGQWMLSISLGWLMLDLTGSAYWVGLIGFASGLPFLVVSIPAGVLIDRLERRAVLLACQTAALAVGLGLAVLVSLGAARPWELLAAAFLNGAALAVNNTARQTLVPSFVPREHLQNGIALMSAGQNVTRVLGPSLAGPALAALGPAGSLFLQAGFLGAALANTLLLPRARPRGVQVLGLRRNLVDGLGYIARSPLLTGLMVLATIPTLFVFPYLQFLPVYARDILDVGADGLGLLYSAGGVGAVVGSLLVAGVQAMRRKGYFMLVSTAVYGLVIIAFAYARWLPLSLAMLFLGGLLGSAYMAVNNTLLHLSVTDEVRGRVMGVYMLTWGLSPLGALPMGYLGDRIGMPAAVAAGAALSSLVTVALALQSRALRAV